MTSALPPPGLPASSGLPSMGGALPDGLVRLRAGLPDGTSAFLLAVAPRAEGHALGWCRHGASLGPLIAKVPGTGVAGLLLSGEVLR